MDNYVYQPKKERYLYELYSGENICTQISNQVLSTIKQRSSVRAYSTEQLTQSELEKILKAELMAYLQG